MPPSLCSGAGPIASFGQILVQTWQSTQVSEIEAFFSFFSGTIEMALRGQTSIHKPHPIQIS
jgi:hypothetical protein